MKKIMTLAIVALFLGFAFNANAQELGTASSAKKSSTGQKEKAVQAEDLEQVLKDFEQAVDECVNMYNSLQNAETGSNYTKEFDKCLTKVENLKSKLDKSKDKLTRSQVKRFNQATQKLSKVYKKQ